MEKIMQIASSVKLMGSIIDSTHHRCFENQDNKINTNGESHTINHDFTVSDDAGIMECPSDGDC